MVESVVLAVALPLEKQKFPRSCLKVFIAMIKHHDQKRQTRTGTETGQEPEGRKLSEAMEECFLLAFSP